MEELETTERIETILEVNKVISEINLMLYLEEKCQTIELTVNRFLNKFDVLRQKGLPNPLVINDKLMRLEDYDKKMREVGKDTSNSSTMK